MDIIDTFTHVDGTNDKLIATTFADGDVCFRTVNTDRIGALVLVRQEELPALMLVLAKAMAVKADEAVTA